MVRNVHGVVKLTKNEFMQKFCHFLTRVLTKNSQTRSVYIHLGARWQSGTLAEVKSSHFRSIEVIFGQYIVTPSLIQVTSSHFFWAIFTEKNEFIAKNMVVYKARHLRKPTATGVVVSLASYGT